MSGKVSHVLVVCLVALLLAPGSARPQVPVKEVATTSGMAARIIHAAMPTFLETGLDITRYRVQIWETDRSYAVLFQDAGFERPSGHRGSPPHRPEYSVELDKDGLQVISAYFVR